MEIFISSKDNKRLPKLDFDVFCDCSRKVGAVVVDHGNFLKIALHPCKKRGGEPHKDVEIFEMCPNTGKTDFEVTEECKKESEVNNLLVEESYKAVCQEVCNILKKAMRDYAYGNGTIEVVKGANKALVFLESRGIEEKKSQCRLPANGTF